MKKLIQILTILFLFHSAYAQRINSEQCIGTEKPERIIAIHDNNDSTTTFLYRRDGYFYSDSMSQAGHKIIVLKLDKNKNILFQKELDSTYYNFLEDDPYYFENDGSFLLVAFNVFPSTIYSTKAEKYDNNGNLLWKSEELYPALQYSDKYSIVKKYDNGYVISQNISSETRTLVSLSATGQLVWSKEISTIDLFPEYTNVGLNQSVFFEAIPKENNKTFISTIPIRIDGLFLSGHSFAYNLVLDSAGNILHVDTIDLGTNIFSSGSRLDKKGNFYFINSYPEQINTDDLSTSVPDLSLGLPIDYLSVFNIQNTLGDNNIYNDISTRYYYKTIGNTTTYTCTDSLSNVLWTYSYTNPVNSVFPTSIIDDTTLFVNNKLVRNGAVVWNLNINNQTDTIFYNGNYYHLTNYSGINVVNNLKKVSISRLDSNNLNIFSIYTYDYCPSLCDYIDVYRFRVVDIKTGIIKQDILIDRNVGSISYIKSTGDGKTFLASTNYQICNPANPGNSDIYLATYTGEYNTLKGIAYIDYNSNNTKESNEPIYPYGFITTASIRDTQTQHLSSVFPFIFFTDTGSYTTKLSLYNDYYISVPVQFVTSYNTYGNIDTLLFALQPRAGINDVSMQLVNNWMTRLGQNNAYTVSVENKGTATANGKVKVLMDARLLNITSSPNYAYRNGDTLVWNIGNLAPLQKGMATISFTGETPTVLNAGDTIISKAWYESDSIDSTPIDNYAEAKEIIRASYDPNEKAILSGEFLTPSQVSTGNYISYIIHFQNKGNDTAFKVIVMDTLSNNVDINSLEIINASHNYTLEIIQNKILKFTFNNIRLSYDTLNISSTGYVSYKIKPKTNLSSGNTIDNTAYIYFDYNEPIQTNTVQTQILLLSAIKTSKNSDGKLTIYPNPNNGIFTIGFENKQNETLQLKLVDITGTIIYQEYKQHNGKSEFVINQTSLAKGIYWIQLTNGNEIYSSAIIVQ